MGPFNQLPYSLSLVWKEREKKERWKGWSPKSRLGNEFLLTPVQGCLCGGSSSQQVTVCGGVPGQDAGASRARQAPEQDAALWRKTFRGRVIMLLVITANT